MSQKLIFAIINNFFSHFIQSFLYKHKAYISISRLEIGLDIFNISETKRFEEYFCISKSFKHKIIGVGGVDFEKIRFQIKHN